MNKSSLLLLGALGVIAYMVSTQKTTTTGQFQLNCPGEPGCPGYPGTLPTSSQYQSFPLGTLPQLTPVSTAGACDGVDCGINPSNSCCGG